MSVGRITKIGSQIATDNSLAARIFDVWMNRCASGQIYQLYGTAELEGFVVMMDPPSRRLYALIPDMSGGCDLGDYGRYRLIHIMEQGEQDDDGF